MHILTMLFVAALLTLNPVCPAVAAPQALGLLATLTPVPLDCSNGKCQAELSAFCLQRDRDIPDPGAAYRVVGDGLALIAVSPDGTVHRLPGAPHLTVTSVRGYTAVTVTVEKSALVALGAVRAAVVVGPKVTLAPIAVAGDPAPQSDLGIELASGPLRELADRVVDNGGPEVGAVRLANSMINALPPHDRVPAVVAGRLWRGVVETHHPEASALAIADEVYEGCRRRVDRGFNFKLRNCLEQEHDRLILDLNLRYWQAIVGS